MPDDNDTRKNITLSILNNQLNIFPKEITRFTNGYCHSVYYVKAEDKEYVLRLTGKANEVYYNGSIKWLKKLHEMKIPVPEILSYGEYMEMFYTLISFLPGKDLGDVYHTLTYPQKRDIVRELSTIQGKVSTLAKGEFYGYAEDGEEFSNWASFLNSQIERSNERIIKNGIWSADICNAVREKMGILSEYFNSVQKTAFLGDITTKNVLIHEGKLSGIVDVDEMCYGDSLLTIGLTKTALLKMGADTDYISLWLDEINAGEIQKKAVNFYTLLFCADFMGEQGMKFDNGNNVEINRDTIKRLSAVFKELYQIL